MHFALNNSLAKRPAGNCLVGNALKLFVYRKHVPNWYFADKCKPIWWHVIWDCSFCCGKNNIQGQKYNII